MESPRMVERIAHRWRKTLQLGPFSRIQDPNKTYQYEPIDEDKHEIRLMTLYPGRFLSPVKVSLTNTAFTSDNVPEFEAISYTWGSPANRKRIYVGGTRANRLLVTQNLAEALPYLRYEDKPRILWIDAICVNQKDLDERSRQVMRMADIYTKASRVVVWLGPESEDSAIAIDYFKAIASHIEVDWGSHVARAVSDDTSWADFKIPLLISEKEATAITSFTDRPWFSRLWIWQEIKLASQESIVLCGRQTLSWECTQKAIFCIAHKAKAGEAKAGCKRLYTLCTRTRYRFPGMARYTINAECSDPRDKVYALLSLLSEEEEEFITPDYNISLEEVLYNTTTQYLDLSQSLEFLGAAQIHARLDLPSWVPDWSDLSRFDPRTHGSSALWTGPCFSIKGKILGVTGILISSVKQCAPVNFAWGSGAEEFGAEIRAVTECLGIQLECTSRPEKLRALVTTLVAGSLCDVFVPLADMRPRIEAGERLIHAALGGNLKDKLDREELLFIETAVGACSTGALFITSEGRIGLGPKNICIKDMLVVLLGCDIPIILRDAGQAQFSVVGGAYCEGSMAGEALCGPVPESFKLVTRYEKKTSYGHWGFVNRETGECRSEDPRLGELPIGWRKGSHEAEELFTWFVNDDTGEGTNRDPRLFPDEVRKRGVELVDFDLV